MPASAREHPRDPARSRGPFSFLARHLVADKEALDGAVAEVEPVPGAQVTQFLASDVKGLG